jgi:hypothetical protein
MIRCPYNIPTTCYDWISFNCFDEHMKCKHKLLTIQDHNSQNCLVQVPDCYWLDLTLAEMVKTTWHKLTCKGTTFYVRFFAVGFKTGNYYLNTALTTVMY